MNEKTAENKLVVWQWPEGRGLSGSHSCVKIHQLFSDPKHHGVWDLLIFLSLIYWSSWLRMTNRTRTINFTLFVFCAMRQFQGRLRKALSYWLDTWWSQRVEGIVRWLLSSCNWTQQSSLTSRPEEANFLFSGHSCFELLPIVWDLEENKVAIFKHYFSFVSIALGHFFWS